jgi:hypothetical protein
MENKKIKIKIPNPFKTQWQLNWISLNENPKWVFSN